MLQKYDAVSWSSIVFIKSIDILHLYYLSDQSVKNDTSKSLHTEFNEDYA